MKNAYELAMERLQKSDPDAVKPLTDEQRNQLAELDVTYRSKIAEREVFLTGKLQAAASAGDAQGAEQIRKQLSSERIRLEEERDAKKETIRAGKQ